MYVCIYLFLLFLIGRNSLWFILSIYSINTRQGHTLTTVCFRAPFPNNSGTVKYGQQFDWSKWKYVDKQSLLTSGTFFRSSSRWRHTVPRHRLLFFQFACSNRTSSLSKYRYACHSFGVEKDYHHQSVSWGPHSSRGTPRTVQANSMGRGCHGYEDRQCLLNSFAITSDEDARWTLGLVKVVAVDGEEGAAHDATSRGGHFLHLWMTNMNAWTTNCSAWSNLVICGKTLPAKVWVMASFPVPKTLNTSLSVELLRKRKKMDNKRHHGWCDTGLKCSREAH